eukprot:CAMPEP_0113880274 /NCGR_PEP_ID=MMETSP0780_2-20120614/7694_1 /TAXON_ID=652834 /ORGANISM="Palpitomonas bilix" /LENGTH=191 /DNA_ID=CAMNT_0000866931 /DNA_START=216 /DNA_END=791 /DNA_ORIENTATION=- /assembly_acc=CAM_ASM_000599
MDVPTRAERKQIKDKTTLEKARLAQRKECYQRYEDIGNPVEPTSQSVGYMSDANRFHTDTAGEQKRLREVERSRASEKHTHMRDQRAHREDERWKTMEKIDKKEEARLTAHLDDKRKRNAPSVAYNPLTLQYNDGKDGMRQKYDDDVMRYRAGVRTHNLSTKASSTGFNPVTHEPVKTFDAPNRPAKPSGI